MDEKQTANVSSDDANFGRQIAAAAARKLKAQKGNDKSIWFGLGISGLIGWSVCIPTLIGAGAGIWLDEHYPSKFSWTLMLLAVGLCIGCYTAWSWVYSQYEEMHEDNHE